MPPVRGHQHIAVRGLEGGAQFGVVRTQSEARYESQKLRDSLKRKGYDIRGSASSGEFSASKPGAQAIRCEWWRCDDEDCREWRATQQTMKGTRV